LTLIATFLIFTINKRKSGIRPILGCLTVFLVLPVFYQNCVSGADLVFPDTTYTSFRLFENDTPLEISLKFDLSTYLRTKPKEDYLKGKITFNPDKPDSITRNIRIRTRGIFRHEWCYYAPIELNFKNADFGYSDLNSVSKIKLVPQCTAGSESEVCTDRVPDLQDV
jgi:hypothetical protein